MAKGAWIDSLQNVDLGLVYVPGGEDCDLIPELVDIRSSAHALIDACEAIGVPFIAFGPVVDSGLKQRLDVTRAIAFVSMGSPRMFPSSLRDVISRWTAGESTLRKGVQYVNVTAELMLHIKQHITLLRATNGYQESAMAPAVAEGDRAPGSIIKLWRALSSKPHEEQLDHIVALGEVVGAHVFRNDNMYRLYRSVVEVAGGPELVPIHVTLEQEWQEFPIEIAILEPKPEMLCVLHPTLRRIQSTFGRTSWRGPTDRGLRILLIQSNVSGEVDECPYGDAKCSPNGLRDVGYLEEEVARLSDLFRSQEPWRIDELRTLRDRRASMPEVIRSLAEPWDIIHYVGHSRGYKDRDRECSCLFLPSRSARFLSPRAKAVPHDYWATAIRVGSHNSLIYFSCCDAGTSGLCAAIAANRHCEAIGFQGGLGTRAACDMAVAFYTELLRPEGPGQADVARALLQARIQMFGQGSLHQVAAYHCTLWSGQKPETT